MKRSAKICLCVSAAIMVLALILSICGLGVNYGIDFAGGLTMSYKMNSSFEVADVNAAIDSLGFSGYQVSKAGDAQTELQIRVPTLDSEDSVQEFQNNLTAILAEKYTEMDTENVNVSYVGPVAGRTLVSNAIWSVILASVLMLVYIAFRFDFCSGLSAVIGLVHDVLMMLAFMVLLRSIIQMNSSFIAAMLTIVGYSINNTIVIFDRIRENRKLHANEMSMTDITSLSVKQSLGRTINTTLTTLLTMVALYVLGVNSIREFALPIIIGILSGVYSANMINGYVWAFLEDKIGGKKLFGAKKAKKKA